LPLLVFRGRRKSFRPPVPGAVVSDLRVALDFLEVRGGLDLWLFM
jgi:hypothetical protein